MVTFQDKFDRTDRDLSGDNGWVVLGSNESASSVLEIKNKYLTTTTTSIAGIATQKGSGNIATTGEQEISCWATSTIEGANQRVTIGIGGDNSGTFANRESGITAQMVWDSSGVRTLEMRAGGPYGSGLLESLEMVSSGTVEQTGYHGRLVDKGAVGVLQHIRLILRSDDYGLKAAIYVNSEDDDKPTIEHYFRSDFVGSQSTDPFGYWLIELSGTATVNSLLVAEISGADYSLADRKASNLKNESTLSELTSRVKRKYSGSTSTDFDDFELQEIINDEVEQILNTLGDAPWFLVRQEEVTLTIDDEGFSTMPAYVERPFYIERKGQKTPAHWAFSHLESDGDVVVRINTEREPSDTTYFVRFLQRWERMDYPEDVCVIPRRHTETVILGACRTLAMTRERSASLEVSYEKLYNERLGSLMREQNRYWRQTKQRLRPRRRAVATPYLKPYRRY